MAHVGSDSSGRLPQLKASRSARQSSTVPSACEGSAGELTFGKRRDCTVAAVATLLAAGPQVASRCQDRFRLDRLRDVGDQPMGDVVAHM